MHKTILMFIHFTFYWLSDKVQCLLLGDQAEEFESLMLSACHRLPIVVLQFVKISISFGIVHLYFYHTDIFT